MTEAEIPDYNLFMRCEKLNPNARTELCKDYYFRNCRPDELEIWKAFPFDSDTIPLEYQAFMNQIIIMVFDIFIIGAMARVKIVFVNFSSKF